MSMYVEPCCVSVTVLRDLHVLTHLPVTTILWGRFLLSLLFFIATSWHVFYSVKFVPFFPFDSIFNWSITDLQCCANLSSSASATHIQTFFFIFFSIMVCHDIEYSSLCYTLGPCCLTLNVIVCISQPQAPSPSLSLPAPLAATSQFSVSASLFQAQPDEVVCPRFQIQSVAKPGFNPWWSEPKLTLEMLQRNYRVCVLIRNQF